MNLFVWHFFLVKTKSHKFTLNDFRLLIFMLGIWWYLKLYLMQSVLFTEIICYICVLGLKTVKQKTVKNLVTHLYADHLKVSFTTYAIFGSKHLKVTSKAEHWARGEFSPVNIDNYFSSPPIARLKIKQNKNEKKKNTLQVRI